MDTIEQQRKQLIDDIQTLPSDILEEISDLIVRFRQQKATSKNETDSAQEPQSAYERLQEAGLIGCIKDGPADGSTNYKQYINEYLTEKYGDR